jgi:hypothetical protein
MCTPRRICVHTAVGVSPEAFLLLQLLLLHGSANVSSTMAPIPLLRCTSPCGNQPLSPSRTILPDSELAMSLAHTAALTHTSTAP